MITNIPFKIYGEKFKTIKFNRFFKSPKYYNKIRKPFIDETGKITNAIYNLFTTIQTKSLCRYVEAEYIYRLDARSTRYMKRVKILEN